MREAWAQVRDELRNEHADVARVLESYDAYFNNARVYSRAMTEPLLAGRV
jgi:hypothetical protein